MRLYTGLITLNADDTEKMLAVITRCWADYDLTSAKMTEQLETMHQAKHPEDLIGLEHIKLMKRRLAYITDEKVVMLLREVVSKEKADNWGDEYDAVQEELEDAKVTAAVGLGEDGASTYSVDGGEEILR